jgi:hypothetical protein
MRDSETQRRHSDLISLVSYMPYFYNVGLSDLHAVSVSVNTPVNVKMPESRLYETRYVYHGNRADLNGVFHKSLPSVCVY